MVKNVRFSFWNKTLNETIKSQLVKEVLFKCLWKIFIKPWRSSSYHHLLHSWSDGRCHSWAWILVWTVQMVIKYLAASMDEVALILQFILF